MKPVESYPHIANYSGRARFYSFHCSGCVKKFKNKWGEKLFKPLFLLEGMDYTIVTAHGHWILTSTILMSHTHASHVPSNTITQHNISTRLENSTTELQTTPHILSITQLDLAHLERSIFYRDDQKRVYQLNPREHPGIVGVLDATFQEMAETQTIDLTRNKPRSGYLITISTSCSECENSPPDTNPCHIHGCGKSIYPKPIAERIMNCPFNGTPLTCSEAIANERFLLHVTDEEETLINDSEPEGSEPPIDTVTFFPDTDNNTEHQPSVFHNERANITSVDTVTIGQPHASEDLAKLAGVLDVIEYVRTHPTVQNGVLNQSPPIPNTDITGLCEDSIETFKKCCNDFLLETAPGWRLRWILEVVTDTHRPISNIADAANVSHEEARLTMSLLHKWGILSESNEPGQNKYKLDDSYAIWRDSIPESGFEIVEPEYLMQNNRPSTLINNAYTALSDNPTQP